MACAVAYHDIIMPLDPEIESGALTVLLVQTLPPGIDDRDPEAVNAASLMIAPSPAYAGIVAGWLTDGVAGKSRTPDAMTASIAQSLKDNWSRNPHDLAAALTDKPRLARAIMMLRVWTKEINLRWPHQNAPLLVLNGRAIADWGVPKPSAESIRNLLLKQ